MHRYDSPRHGLVVLHCHGVSHDNPDGGGGGDAPSLELPPFVDVLHEIDDKDPDASGYRLSLAAKRVESSSSLAQADAQATPGR